MFICGNSHRQEKDDIDSWSPCSTPKRSKRIGSYKNKQENKNPFANRGLDKFYALLAELEDKKRKIYTQKGADEIALLHFVYGKDNEIKPVVVSRFKEKKQVSQILELKHVKAQVSEENVDQQRHKKKKIFKLKNLKKPSYYLPLVMILILIFLAIFGRSFAILCTSIGWYLLPSLKGGDQRLNSTRQKRKKEHSRRSILSDEKQFVNNDGLSSPRSVMNGPVDMSPRKHHGHKGSW